MEIKNLGGVSFDRIFDVFSSAFSDYDFQLGKQELETMLLRRGFDPKLSFAAFDGDWPVAFTLNGTGMFGGVRTAYDTGTGTVKEFRGRGLAAAVFRHSIPFLKESGVDQYLLEVLQHNDKAVSVYRRLGFEAVREFCYFHAKNNAVTFGTDHVLPYTLRRIGLDQLGDFSRFMDFHPSWQNSFESVGRKPEDFIVLGAFDGRALTGYCIFEPVSGDLTQIAVDKEHRRQGIGSRLLREALGYNRNDTVKVVNTDSACDAMTGFLCAGNIPVAGKQFEMIRSL